MPIMPILVSSSPPKSGGAYFRYIAYGVGGVSYVESYSQDEMG